MKKDRIFFIFSLIFIFSLFFLAPLDTDLGWHLRYGEYFIKTGTILKTNILTYYLNNYFWPNSYFLYQVIVYLVFKYFGYLGLAVGSSVLFSVCYLFFSRIHPKTPRINFLVFTVISIFSWQVFNLGLRAQLFSFFFVILIFYIFEKSRKNTKYLFVIPPVFLLWTNLHGAFPLGLIVVLALSIERILSEPSSRIMILGVLIITVFATLINPYGTGPYFEGFLHITYPLGKLIAEWVPPELLGKAIIISMLFTSLYVFSLPQVKRKILWLSLLTIFGALSLMARRNIPYVAIVFSEAMFSAFNEKLINLENNNTFRSISISVLMLGLIYVPVFMLSKNYAESVNSNSYCNNSFLVFPCQAAEFLKVMNIKNKNIFSNYEWGGYLEWNAPDNKYFVDGRMPTWPTPEKESPYSVFLYVIQAQSNYESVLDKYKTDLILISSGSYLDIELQNNHTVWYEIYRDAVSVIYARKA